MPLRPSLLLLAALLPLAACSSTSSPAKLSDEDRMVCQDQADNLSGLRAVADESTSTGDDAVGPSHYAVGALTQWLNVAESSTLKDLLARTEDAAVAVNAEAADAGVYGDVSESLPAARGALADLADFCGKG